VALMLYLTRNGFHHPAFAAAEIEKLERLAADLRKLLAGNYPTANDLREAPKISSWLTTELNSPALAGMLSGHPKLPGNRGVTTSPIAVSARDLGWIGTNSRYYRLGQKFGFDKDLGRGH
jgi:hypothetical protein